MPARPTALIADDEPMLLRGLDRVLTRAGYEVITANDGQQAAELLTQLEFDAIVRSTIPVLAWRSMANLPVM